MKETGKMFKSLGKVADKIKGIPGPIGAIGEGISSLLPFLEALGPLFQAFEPIMTIFNAMFTAFAGALTAELIPALQPLFAALIDLIPIFMELGQIVGQIFVLFLVPLIDYLLELIPIFMIVGEIVGQVLMEVLVVLMDIMMAILPPLTDIMIQLIESEGFLMMIYVVLGLLASVIISMLIPIGVLVATFMVLVAVFDFIIEAVRNVMLWFAYLIDAITLGMAGAVDYVNTLFGTMPAATESVVDYTPTPTTTPGGGYQELQGGTDMVTRSGTFGLHVGEAVTTSSEAAMQTGLLEEIRDLQREQLLETKWRTR
jgi:hypothetical protein